MIYDNDKSPKTNYVTEKIDVPPTDNDLKKLASKYKIFDFNSDSDTTSLSCVSSSGADSMTDASLSSDHTDDEVIVLRKRPRVDPNEGRIFATGPSPITNKHTLRAKIDEYMKRYSDDDTGPDFSESDDQETPIQIKKRAWGSIKMAKTKQVFRRLGQLHGRMNPDAPKHPISAYMYYYQDNLAEIKRKTIEAYGRFTIPNTTKMTSKAWNALSDEEKRPYREKGRLDLERYKREKAEFEAKRIRGLSDDEFDDDVGYALGSSDDDIHIKSKTIINRSFRKKFDRNEPYSAKSAYSMFTEINKREEGKKLVEEFGPKYKISLLVNRLGEKWEALPESEKEQYRILAAEDLKRYRTEMTVYFKKRDDEKKMAMEKAKEMGVEFKPDEFIPLKRTELKKILDEKARIEKKKRRRAAKKKMMEMEKLRNRVDSGDEGDSEKDSDDDDDDN